MDKPVNKVPFVGLDRQFTVYEDSYLEIFKRVGASGWWVMAPSIEKFETEMAAYCDTKYAIGVANGTDALVLILKALGIGPGDEVVVPANSFIASAGAVAVVGATPVFAEVATDLNIDPAELTKVMTPKTKAIMAVHLTGRPSDMNALNAIAEKHGVVVIEDAAQAIGAKYCDKKVGGLGVAGAFSMHPLKNLNVMGDGGFVTTSDSNLYKKIKSLQNHGLASREDCIEWGWNSRLDALQAEIASFHLSLLDQWTQRVRDVAQLYSEGLSDVVCIPKEREYEFNVYHTYVILCDRRDELVTYLKSRGIDTAIHYSIPIHLQKPAFDQGYKEGDFPVTEEMARKMVSLPIYPTLKNDEINHVIASVRSFYQAT